jgi:uncharacterized protein (TIGR04255 family)
MSKARGASGDLADYDRPPVIEVVYGVRFAPLQAWKLPHIGIFWQQILNEFPRCEHAPPITGPDFIDPTTALPIPRVWLINSTDDRLVQLQSGRFLFNWRRRDGAAPYPRYSTLSKRFFDLFREFRGFVAKNQIGEIHALEYELTYINHVFEQDGWKFPDSVGRVVEHLAWQKELYQFLPPPVPTNWQARFAFPEGPGTLSVKLNPATHAKEGKDLLALELSARGLPADAALNNMEAWFSHAHRWIVCGFEDLTSDEAQKVLWGKQ